MYELFNVDKRYMLPNGITYNGAELITMPGYEMLGNTDCVIDVDGGVMFAMETLASFARRYNVDNAGAPTEVFDDAVRAKKEYDETYKAQYATDLQLQAIARMQVASMSLTSMQTSKIAEFCDYWPEWQVGKDYKQNDAVLHKGKCYRVSKALTSQEIYPPDTAGESEYYPIEVASDGIVVYRECHGEYDQVKAGETRHYPTASDPVYRAKVDTAYDPKTVPANWELVG